MTADEEGGKLLLSEPKQIISLIGDDAPQYVESESEINEESINKKIVEKILEGWKGKIRPCRVKVEKLTPADIEKRKKRLLQKGPVLSTQKGPVLIPLVSPNMSEVEAISETDLEMFPEDTSSVVTDSPARAGKVHIKPVANTETSTERKKEKPDANTSLGNSSQQVRAGDKENVIEENGSVTVKEAESAFNTSTEIENKNSIPSPSYMNTSTEICTADEIPEIQKQNTSNPVTLRENVEHQTNENGDNDDFVDPSQSLFDDKIFESDDVVKQQKISSANEENKEKLIRDGKSEDSLQAIKADDGENECKTVKEAKQEESDDEDEVISLRPDSDSEPEVDVTNVLNSGEDETCIIDGEISEAINIREDPSKGDDGIPESLSHQSADVEFVSKDEKENDLLELKSSVFDEVPDSPVIDLLPDKSDSEPDEDEWIHTSKMESAVDESDISGFDAPVGDTMECHDDEDIQKNAHNEDDKKDEPDLLEHRSLRSLSRLSLSAKKKKKSGDGKSSSPIELRSNKRQTRSSPITVKQEDIKPKRKTMSSNITGAGEGTKDGKSKAEIRGQENKNDDTREKVENLESFKTIKKESDDHFESPLSQISNGFTIETNLICDDEINIIEECANEDDSINTVADAYLD